MSNWKDPNRKNKSYTLFDYQPRWPDEFEELKALVAPLFGDNLIAFEHIGSTSVPGMLGKDQIDVCAIVKDLNKVKKVIPDFENLGFVAKGDYVGQNEEYFTYNQENGDRKFNIHTLETGNPEIDGYLSFREYLRANKDAKQEYIDIKEKLRTVYGEDDYNSYDWGKGDFIEPIKQRAREWYAKNHARE